MSGAVVRWGEHPQISASRDAVMIHDTWEFRSLEEYEKFSELLKAAMSLHIDMKHSHDPHEVAKRFCNE